MSEWEKIRTSKNNFVRRLEVPGGWLYDVGRANAPPVFVPEVNEISWAEHDSSEALSDIANALARLTSYQVTVRESVGAVSQTWKVGPPDDADLQAIATAALRFKDWFAERYPDQKIECPYIRGLFEAVDAWLDDPEVVTQPAELSEASVG